ncbi:hypothetical protein AAC387_Pa02g1644 [Persea americana]
MISTFRCGVLCLHFLFLRNHMEGYTIRNFRFDVAPVTCLRTRWYRKEGVSKQGAEWRKRRGGKEDQHLAGLPSPRWSLSGQQWKNEQWELSGEREEEGRKSSSAWLFAVAQVESQWKRGRKEESRWRPIGLRRKGRRERVR